jgi:phospholipase/carboxylesterase
MEAVMRRVRIDRSRIFLTGFSQGGNLTYALAVRHPEAFRGIAPLGAGRSRPGPTEREALFGMRVYIGHGSLEPGLEEVRELAATLEAAGCEVMLRVYPGIGHGIPRPAETELAHILEFLSVKN